MHALPLLFLLDSHHVGGAEYSWVELIERLDRRRVAASFIAPSWSEYDGVVRRAQQAGARCLDRAQIEGTFDWRGRRRIASGLATARGVVHFNQNTLTSCRQPITLAARRGVARLSTVRGFGRFGGDGWMRWRCRRSIAQLDGVVALSQALRRHVHDHAPGQQVEVIGHFVTPQRLAQASELRARRDELRRRLALEPSQRVAVSVVTRLGAKGQDQLLEELPRALRQLPELVLVLVGRDHDGVAARLIARAEALRCAHALRLVGWHDEIFTVLAAADAMVHAPRVEGLGRVLLEAMAASLPVVSYAAGGIADVVEEGVTGHLVPIGDSARLLDLLVERLAAPEQARAMGQVGRARVEERFSASQVVGRYHDLWESAAARAASA